jgi:hypothetical protein
LRRGFSSAQALKVLIVSVADRNPRIHADFVEVIESKSVPHAFGIRFTVEAKPIPGWCNFDCVGHDFHLMVCISYNAARWVP